MSSDPSIAGGQFITASAFMSDAITVGPALTINAGLRFDHSRAISQDLPVAGCGRPRDRRHRRAVSARCTRGTCGRRALGVTTKLDRDGRTMLRGSYGRFNQGVLTGELAPFHPAATPTTTDCLRSRNGRLHHGHLGCRSEYQPATGSCDTDATHRRVPRSVWIARSVAGFPRQ